VICGRCLLSDGLASIRWPPGGGKVQYRRITGSLVRAVHSASSRLSHCQSFALSFAANDFEPLSIHRILLIEIFLSENLYRRETSSTRRESGERVKDEAMDGMRCMHHIARHLHGKNSNHCSSTKYKTSIRADFRGNNEGKAGKQQCEQRHAALASPLSHISESVSGSMFSDYLSRCSIHCLQICFHPFRCLSLSDLICWQSWERGRRTDSLPGMILEYGKRVKELDAAMIALSFEHCGTCQEGRAGEKG
jgi:hypothetical protein